MFYSNLKYKNVFMSPHPSRILGPIDEDESFTTKTSTKEKMNLITAIKKLLAKLGANDLNGKNLVNIINEASDKVQGLPVPAVKDIGKAVFAGNEGYELKEIPSVPEIPIPDIEDAGKAIVVDENANYELLTLSIETVVFTYDNSSSTYSCNKTFTEVGQMLSKCVPFIGIRFFSDTTPNQNTYTSCVGPAWIHGNLKGYCFDFITSGQNSSFLSIMSLTLMDDNSVSAVSKSITYN